MSNAYRVHFQPAAQQLSPGADPYIVSLVQAASRPATSQAAGARHSEHRLERHSEALAVSFDRNMEACVVERPLAADCRQSRADRRPAPQRVATVRRSRAAWAGA